MAGDANNRGFDGSSAVIGTTTVSPLMSFRRRVEVAKARTSGADASYHTERGGRKKTGFDVGFLGSRVPGPGINLPVSFTFKDGTTASFANTAITRVSITGRRDGNIAGTISAWKSAAALGAFTPAAAAGDTSFNGSSATFNASAITRLLSIAVEAEAAEVDDSGAEVTDALVTPGIPRWTITITVLGGATLDKGTQAAMAIAWHDGGDLGSFALVELMDIRDGGDCDGEVTTEYVFKPCTAA